MARSLSLVVALGCILAFGCSDAAPVRSGKATVAAKPAKPSKKRAKSRRAVAAHMSTVAVPEATPAVRYAQLTQIECEAELTRRNIEFVREVADGVLAPVRLLGPLHGVEFRTNQSAKARETSRWEIADCRLVLALDDFTAVLRDHDIVEVRHYSMWRPAKGLAEGVLGARHEGALAIDAGKFIDKAGVVLDVDEDFHGKIDAKTCGEGAAPKPPTPAALKLRAILCDAAERRLFNVMLTPNYNRPHKNHFHLEVTAGASWFLVH